MAESVDKPASQNQLIAVHFFPPVAKGCNKVNCKRCGKEVKENL